MQLYCSKSLCAYHVWLGGKFLCLQTLDGHPLDRQFSLPVVLNTVIFLIENISGHAKVRHLHRIRLIQPEERKSQLKDSLETKCFKSNRDTETFAKFSACLGNSHAVACSEISVHKLLLGQILHPLGNLQPKANQILYSGVLKKSMNTQQDTPH